uniref:Transposase n=1 Tax=Romanomermis culicivorax TaxID=13658 RepID=A0A915HP63_ROMCU
MPLRDKNDRGVLTKCVLTILSARPIHVSAERLDRLVGWSQTQRIPFIECFKRRRVKLLVALMALFIDQLPYLKGKWRYVKKDFLRTPRNLSNPTQKTVCYVALCLLNKLTLNRFSSILERQNLEKFSLHGAGKI